MQSTNSLEKIWILGKIEGRRRSRWQRTRWVDSITDSMDMIPLSRLQERVKDREVWRAVHMGSQRVGHDLVTEQQWELAIWHRELNLVLCDSLKGWEFHEGGDIPAFWFMLMYAETRQYCKAIILQINNFLKLLKIRVPLNTQLYYCSLFLSVENGFPRVILSRETYGEFCLLFLICLFSFLSQTGRTREIAMPSRNYTPYTRVLELTTKKTLT